MKWYYNIESGHKVQIDIKRKKNSSQKRLADKVQNLIL